MATNVRVPGSRANFTHKMPAPYEQLISSRESKSRALCRLSISNRIRSKTHRVPRLRRCRSLVRVSRPKWPGGQKLDGVLHGGFHDCISLKSSRIPWRPWFLEPRCGRHRTEAMVDATPTWTEALLLAQVARTETLSSHPLVVQL